MIIGSPVLVGGGGGLYPSIFVTGLPEGATVAATNGSKTVAGQWATAYGQSGADGYLLSPIRELGAWTVTATNGARAITQEVLVDVVTTYEVEMSFKSYLYNEGDECEEVTGGWVVQALGLDSTYNSPDAPTLTRNATSMVASRATAYGTWDCGLIKPQNRVDFTGYNTINAIISTAFTASNAFFRGYYRSELGDYCEDGTPWCFGGALSESLATGSIEDLSGLFVPYFMLYSGGSVTIHKVWLE